jgi:nicotinamide mononucleotide (NMN) deamidase PncC
MDKTVYSPVERVSQLLNSKGIITASIESRTDGWIAKCMTEKHIAHVD